MTFPKISIVVPIYGVEKYLHQCVDSILGQTLNDIEIILVDDGSKDKCPEIIDEYAHKDPRIVAVHQPNGGYGRAVNHGIKLAKGEYIGIVEPDDFIELNMYEKLYNNAIQTNADVTKASFRNIYVKTGCIKTSNLEKDISNISNPFTIDDAPILLYYHPSIWTCIYKKSFLNDNNIIFEETPGASWGDNPFQVKTLLLAKRISFIPDIVYNYRKFNLHDALDLKDATIPYNRSVEIHNWLEKQPNVSKNIWAYLIKREIAYMHIIINMRGGIKHLKNVKDMLSNWAQALPHEIIQANKNIKKKEYKFLKRISSRKLFWLIFYRYKKIFNLKNIRRFLFSLNIKNSNFCIQILGIQISNNINNKPALMKIKL